MKNNLIKQYCTTRSKIDDLALTLKLSCIGSRESVLNRIRTASYKDLKDAISKLKP